MYANVSFAAGAANDQQKDLTLLKTPGTVVEIMMRPEFTKQLNAILDADGIANIQGGNVYPITQQKKQARCFINKVNSRFRLESGVIYNLEDPRLFGDRYRISFFIGEQFTFGCRNEKSYTQDEFSLADLKAIFGKNVVVELK